MENQREITQTEIDAEKNRIHSLGIAHFSINGMDEDTSIRQALREKWSYFYVGVADPYTRGKHPRFRIFQTDKANPKIPMGYYGMPTFTFECYDGEPMKTAVNELKKLIKRPFTPKINGDEVTLVPVLTDEQKQSKEAEKQAEIDKYTPKDTDTPQVAKIKAEIKLLESTSERMKLANKAISKNDDQALKDLGYSDEAIYKLKNPQFGGSKGFPSYRLTSVASKIRRLKAKI